jgi:hypothetical protein
MSIASMRRQRADGEHGASGERDHLDLLTRVSHLEQGAGQSVAWRSR